MTYRAFRVGSLSFFVSLTCAFGARASGPEWFEPATPKPPTDQAAPKTPANQGAPKASPAPDQAASTAATPTATAAVPAAATAAAPTAAAATPPAPAAPAPVPAKPRSAPRAAALRATSPAPTRTEWYGWQTLAADGASAALVLGGIAAEKPNLAVAGVLSYLLVPPTLHSVKGRHEQGGISVAFRLAGPFVGAMIGMGASDVFCPSCVDYSPGLIAGGALLGIVSGPVVDALFLSKREVKTGRAAPRAAFAPSVVPVREGATFGLSGSF